LLIAQHRNLYGRTDRRVGNPVYQLRAVLDRLTIEGDDHVFRFDASLLGGPARRHFPHEDTLLGAIKSQKLGLHLGKAYADGAARHFAMLDDGVINFRGRIYRQSEADSLIATRTADDRRVDSDHI